MTEYDYLNSMLDRDKNSLENLKDFESSINDKLANLNITASKYIDKNEDIPNELLETYNAHTKTLTNVRYFINKIIQEL